ncbi:hypothetical protein EVAR_45034_1 [Eumeta japonica]|uniref:Uncharacterized protein n=1 Tax=Eumeta variegata TaxID=151549 RepID=A0A4C1YPZ1_EUMVA|nr:hypothetical protein EVAR_45034_1 [Eumeta japonica]
MQSKFLAVEPRWDRLGYSTEMGQLDRCCTLTEDRDEGTTSVVVFRPVSEGRTRGGGGTRAQVITRPQSFHYPPKGPGPRTAAPPYSGTGVATDVSLHTRLRYTSSCGIAYPYNTDVECEMEGFNNKVESIESGIEITIKSETKNEERQRDHKRWRPGQDSSVRSGRNQELGLKTNGPPGIRSATGAVESDRKGNISLDTTDAGVASRATPRTRHETNDNSVRGRGRHRCARTPACITPLWRHYG